MGIGGGIPKKKWESDLELGMMEFGVGIKLGIPPGKKEIKTGIKTGIPGGRDKNGNSRAKNGNLSGDLEKKMGIWAGIMEKNAGI